MPESEEPAKCCVCGKTEEEIGDSLRPYGPEYAPICCPCAELPANVDEVIKNSIALMDIAASGKAVIVTGGRLQIVELEEIPTNLGEKN